MISNFDSSWIFMNIYEKIVLSLYSLSASDSYIKLSQRYLYTYIILYLYSVYSLKLIKIIGFKYL